MKISDLYNSPWANEYVNNKYIYEHASDPNSAEAQNAAAANAKIRETLGMGADTMDYETVRTRLANYSPYFEKAANSQVDPKYKQESDRLYNAIHNFSYNAKDDPTYQAYSDALDRESASAQKNTYAQMTTNSGGRNNSWASAATAQVGQAYAQKKGEVAASLAQQAYNRLVDQYGIAQNRYQQAVNEADNAWSRNMQMGQNQVTLQRNELADERENERFDWERKNFEQSYNMNNETFKTQQKLLENELIRDNILTEKNQKEFEKWLDDPYYEIKDETLAKAVADSEAYKWLREHAPEYLYSKFY